MSKQFYVGLVILCLGAIVIGTAFRGEKQTPGQKWEYKVISVSRNIGDDGWTQRYEDNNLVKSSSTLEILKTLGEQGWELVSVSPISSTYHEGFENPNGDINSSRTTPSYAGFTSSVYYYLKRPKQ